MLDAADWMLEVFKIPFGARLTFGWFFQVLEGWKPLYSDGHEIGSARLWVTGVYRCFKTIYRQISVAMSPVSWRR